METDNTPLFSVGELVYHKLFRYRGVIIDVDPQFMLTEEWYQTMANTEPPKDQPWYHVLVHNSSTQTYVAQRNLMLDQSADPINNPAITHVFANFESGKYRLGTRMN